MRRRFALPALIASLLAAAPLAAHAEPLTIFAAASLTVAGAVAVVVYDVVHHRPVFHALRS